MVGFKESRPDTLSGLSTDGPAFRPGFPLVCLNREKNMVSKVPSKLKR